MTWWLWSSVSMQLMAMVSEVPTSPMCDGVKPLIGRANTASQRLLLSRYFPTCPPGGAGRISASVFTYTLRVGPPGTVVAVGTASGIVLVEAFVCVTLPGGGVVSPVGVVVPAVQAPRRNVRVSTPAVRLTVIKCPHAR